MTLSAIAWCTDVSILHHALRLAAAMASSGDARRLLVGLVTEHSEVHMSLLPSRPLVKCAPACRGTGARRAVARSGARGRGGSLGWCSRGLLDAA